jgi:hypothetical protein
MADADTEELVQRLHELPEALALEIYSKLSPRLQWLVRRMITGPRRKASIVHHLLTAGRSG